MPNPEVALEPNLRRAGGTFLTGSYNPWQFKQAGVNLTVTHDSQEFLFCLYHKGLTNIGQDRSQSI